MRRAIRFWIGALALFATAAQVGATEPIPEGEEYGAGITLAELTPLAEVVNHPERHEGQTLLVKGVVREVCQRRGCWMVVVDGESHVRIRFADYGFFVPKDCSGKDAYVEGEVQAEVIDEEEARHYEAESPGGDPSKIHGPQRVVSFTATGVRLVPSK